MTDDRLLARVLEALEPRGSRLGAVARARRTAGIPAYLSDLRVVHGHCRGGTKRAPCRSRYGVIRVTFDYRDSWAVDSFAHVECVRCGKVWRRVRVPKLGEYQSVLLTLILPDAARRWFARGTWHREGADAIVRTNATWSDLMEAAADWRARNTAKVAQRAKAQAKKAASDAEAVARARELMERIHEREAEREAEEAAAAAREAQQ